MTRRTGARLRFVYVLICIAIHSIMVASASGYTGGPVRAYVAGLEPTEHRVFYYLIYHDESTCGPQVWYFDLDGGEPTRPIRALSLEGEDDGIRTRRTEISDAWRAFSPSLTAPLELSEVDLALDLKADSVGIAPYWFSTRYEADLTVEAQGVSRTMGLVLFCDTELRVRGVYGIPGHREILALVSYKGRAYGCEEVDLPILLGAEPASLSCLTPRRGAAEDDSVRGEPRANGHIVTTPDPFQPVTWYTTARNITKQYDEHISFDVEIYFGWRDDGAEFVRFLSAYRNKSSDDHTAKPLHFERVRLTDDAGRYSEIFTGHLDGQVLRCPEGVFEWSDYPLIEPWHVPFRGLDWLEFAHSESIRVRFEGAEVYEFDMTSDQIAAIGEIIEHYKNE